jgi:hypothetical protein
MWLSPHMEYEACLFRILQVINKTTTIYERTTIIRQSFTPFTFYQG